VKSSTIQPSNVEKWRELFGITFGLLKNQSSLPVSTAWTLARTMMLCYDCDAADLQLCLTLWHHLGSWETDDQRPHMPLNALFSFYFGCWIDDYRREGYWNDQWQAIAFLEPSEAAGVELLWMVNTFHRVMRFSSQLYYQHDFFHAVLIYVSSTEQSRRSKVPLTAAVIHAMHTIISANQGKIDPIDGLFILPGTVTTSESVPMTFCPVAGIDMLDLWSEGCIQFVKDLLQLDQGSYWHHNFQLSLIAALYIESTKQVHAHSTFADLLKCTSIKDPALRYSDAYADGKLTVYWYMAISHKPLDQDCNPITTLHDVIQNAITEYLTLQLSGLRILEIAVKHAQKVTPCSLDWLKRVPFGLRVFYPDRNHWGNLVCVGHWVDLAHVDHWVLLHLDTLLAPQPYLLPEDVKGLKWSNRPGKVHIAKAQLDLYDSLATADHVESWRFLQSYVVPKWSMLPSSWCINFALVFLFSTVQPRHTHSLPAYQCLVNAIWYRSTDGSTFFPFLEPHYNSLNPV